MAYAQIDIPAADEKSKQDTSLKQISRDKTDFPFAIAFGNVVVCWLATALYAFCQGDSAGAFDRNVLYHQELFEILEFLIRNAHHARKIILTFALVAVVLSVTFIVLFRWATKVLVIISMVSLIGVTVLLLTLTGYVIYYQHPFLVIVIGTCTLIHSITLYAFIKAGVDLVSKIIRESCKAMFFFPSTILVMFFQFIFQVFLIVFASATFVFLHAVRINPDRNVTWEDDDNYENVTFDQYLYGKNSYVPGHIYFLHAFNVCAYFWVSYFFLAWGRMGLTATFATWYQIKDRSLISNFAMPQCFLMVIRYHVGTLAYASSVFAVYPICCAVWQESRNKLKEVCKRPIYIYSWLLALIKLSYDALAMTAVHGKAYYDSIKDSYILLMRNPVGFLAVNSVSETIIFLGVCLPPTLTFFISWGYCLLQEGLEREIAGTAVIIVTFISFLMSLALFMVFRAASNTIRFCYLEDSKFNHEAEMNMYEIQADEMDIDI